MVPGQSSDIRNPILYIVNKVDQPGEKEVNRYDFKKNFRNIVDFVEINCRAGDGIQELRDTIIRHLPELSTWGAKLKKN